MKNSTKDPGMNSKQPAVVEQVMNNTTSWIGHRPGDSNDLIGGQTFLSPTEGDLDKIEVFSSMVTDPGQVSMTLYSFDAQLNKWGSALGSASIQLSKTDTGKWVCFNMPHLHLQQGQSYGFKLESPNTFIGVGEAAGSHKQPPFTNGQEWKFHKERSERTFILILQPRLQSWTNRLEK